MPATKGGHRIVLLVYVCVYIYIYIYIYCIILYSTLPLLLLSEGGHRGRELRRSPESPADGPGAPIIAMIITIIIIMIIIIIIVIIVMLLILIMLLFSSILVIVIVIVVMINCIPHGPGAPARKSITTSQYVVL